MKQTQVQITHYPIKLGQFLKLADITSDGFEAKALIINSQVRVNGDLETRRGRQLAIGDTITVDGTEYVCA